MLTKKTVIIINYYIISILFHFFQEKDRTTSTKHFQQPGASGCYALVLGEVGGKRQLPIIIGATEAQAMVIEMKGIVPPRPLTHNLFASVLEVLGVKTDAYSYL